jgi:hypothetical protein
MSTIVLRSTKGSPLTNTEVDANFNNLNTDKLESTWAGASTLVTLGTVTTGTWSATAIAANKGGTGQTVYTIGDLVYASSTTALSKLNIGTASQVLTASAGGLPVWADMTSLDVGIANNIDGGAIGSVPYQTAVATTAFLALGTNGYVLTAGSSAPRYVAPSTLTVGTATTATNIAGGAAGSLPYNTGSGATTMLAKGTIGYFLTAGATAPVWTQTLPVANGGTAAANAADARDNLDVDQAGTAVAMAIALG